MTHEELLQKLADIAHNKDAHEARNDYLLALRAVVELHKPETHYRLPTKKQRDEGMQYDDPNLAYQICSCGYVETIIADDGYPSTAVGRNNYPCPTIQAIQEQLK